LTVIALRPDALESGSSMLEVPAGCRLPRHTDSAEETILVLAGAADVTIGDERTELPAGGIAVVPKSAPHEVRNAGEETLRFVAVYSGAIRDHPLRAGRAARRQPRAADGQLSAGQPPSPALAERT
jgi:quercetin dioxygenase-like cupin family protein